MAGGSADCNHQPTLRLCQAWLISSLWTSPARGALRASTRHAKESAGSATSRFCRAVGRFGGIGVGKSRARLETTFGSEGSHGPPHGDLGLVLAHGVGIRPHRSLANEGDLRKARTQAEIFVNVAVASGERSGEQTWYASAWEVNARVAMAEGKLEDARDCIVKATAAVENSDIPLASWRVHATAAELYRLMGTPASRNTHKLSAGQLF
jgi:hypothetical protein